MFVLLRYIMESNKQRGPVPASWNPSNMVQLDGYPSQTNMHTFLTEAHIGWGVILNFLYFIQ